MTKAEQHRQEVRDKLNALTMEALDFDACECLNPSDLENGTDYVMETLEEHVRETSDIIYYSRAIEYLSEHDASLRRSLELADELGYKPADLNSELLASLLNENETLAELWRIRDEVEELVDERNEIEEDEEEDAPKED